MTSRFPLLSSLGLITPPDGKVPKKVEELLVDHLETFIRGGGRISWTEWIPLSDIEKMALAEAGDRVRAEQANDVAESLVALLDGQIQAAEVEAAAQGALRR